MSISILSHATAETSMFLALIQCLVTIVKLYLNDRKRRSEIQKLKHKNQRLQNLLEQQCVCQQRPTASRRNDEEDHESDSRGDSGTEHNTPLLTYTWSPPAVQIRGEQGMMDLSKLCLMCTEPCGVNCVDLELTENDNMKCALDMLFDIQVEEGSSSKICYGCKCDVIRWSRVSNNVARSKSFFAKQKLPSQNMSCRPSTSGLLQKQVVSPKNKNVNFNSESAKFKTSDKTKMLLKQNDLKGVEKTQKLQNESDNGSSYTSFPNNSQNMNTGSSATSRQTHYNLRSRNTN